MKKITFALITLASILFSNSYSQDLFNSNNLSTVNVDKLTDDQIDQVKSQLANKGENIDQVKPLVISKGMSEIEFNKLKTRINTVKDSEVKNTSPTIQPDKKEVQSIIQETSPTNPFIFGSELFTNPSLNFEPNNKIATPVNYILGPNDRLQISVYGIQEFITETEVSSEGGITIPHVGYISVIGMTIESATQKIKKAISKVYSTVNSGQSQVTVNITQIRTIKITIIGGQQPGNYSVSSLASVFNALHLAGGPGNNGSYRNIELIRNNKIYKIVDLYRYILKGDQSDNIGLKENDVIRIPTVTTQVSLEGEVKRPGLFEMKPGETFKDLLNFASGFNDLAYTGSINIQQHTNKELKIQDINSSEFDTYQPNSGDSFTVKKILETYENRIRIEGSVFRPGSYSFNEGMRIWDLISQASGLKDDAYYKRAIITRYKTDLISHELLYVNLLKVSQGDTAANFLLKKEDILTIYSLYEFQESSKINIYGEIKKPGIYDYIENLTLNDIIIKAGGLLGASSKKVEIARMIRSELIDDNNSKKSELFNIEINPETNEQLLNFELKPNDVINIRKMAVYDKPELVTVTGAVMYPGLYVLSNKKEKVYDVIIRAGGLTNFANINGIKINRKIQAKQIEEIESVNPNIGVGEKDKLTQKLKEEIKFLTIPIEWKKISKNQKNSTNITLQLGDEIVISVNNECVKISGNVLLTSEIPFNKGKRFRYYINAVGGKDAKAWLRKAYIIYPNGRANTTSSFLFFKCFPKVLAGSQIVIPEKPSKNKVISPVEVMGVASVFTSLAGIVIAIIKL